MEDLMNEQPNTPMSPQPSGFASWADTWMDALTKPTEQTFSAMASHPDAMTNGRAFTWVFLAGTLAAMISGVLQAVLQMAGIAPQVPGLDELMGNASSGPLVSLGIALCASPISGGISVLFFAIYIGIIQWVAKMFSGTGTFSQLAYTMAAISVPISLITSILSPFGTLNVVGYCVNGISVLVGFYALFLQLTAVKAVNKFGWGQAVGSYFLPLILLVCICGCLVFAMLSALGPAVGDVFSQINQSLGP